MSPTQPQAQTPRPLSAFKLYVVVTADPGCMGVLWPSCQAGAASPTVLCCRSVICYGARRAVPPQTLVGAPQTFPTSIHSSSLHADASKQLTLTLGSPAPSASSIASPCLRALAELRLSLGCFVPGPGISSYADNPTRAGASLRACLDKAMTIIPVEQQRETPTYLGATAGMRLLREQNSTKADLIFAEVSKTIRQYPVDFRGARILTGNEEGSFGWITINYLLETLIKFSFTGTWIHPEAAAVVGALDLGGASTQITFHPGRAIEDNNTEVLFWLYGTNYSLYTHSYLCYGENQALKKLIASLREENLTSQQISHPCYPRGYEENVTAAALYDSPCVPAPAAHDPSQILTVRGTGAPAECRNAVQKLFNFTACGANRTCGFNGVYQPPEHGQFFAFSGFYSVFHFLNLTSGHPLSDVSATIEHFCAKDWKEVQMVDPGMNKTRLQDYCAASTYILTLLLQGYKFDNETWSNIHFHWQVAAVDVGWSLGYMLNLTNTIPLEAPNRVKGQRPDLWAAAVVTTCLMLAMILWTGLALCYQWPHATYETML
ncbi:ectonucleoside triphosphate diphosphohydrolase 8-like isoform X1 [Chrysemys picta bellii]|uniref:ectonucleoside triphosphate diphosphohydrolase 8-like isoform X1 n=1 Tax=Chrysemys picta bellii TaxID=8478 RepID=UPI0032B1DF6C